MFIVLFFFFQRCEWRFQFDVRFSGNFKAANKVELEVKAPAHGKSYNTISYIPLYSIFGIKLTTFSTGYRVAFLTEKYTKLRIIS